MNRNPNLRLYDGRYLAFAGTFLGKSRPYMSAEELAAAEIIRAVVERADYTGCDPIAKVHEIQRRALESIEEIGLAAFVERHGVGPEPDRSQTGAAPEPLDPEAEEMARSMSAG